MEIKYTNHNIDNYEEYFNDTINFYASYRKVLKGREITYYKNNKKQNKNRLLLYIICIPIMVSITILLNKI